ncbi:MAG: UDP-glucose 4-epimerase GalE [Proteobacteria bacterium]|nr:UDP-glucose 4-epimerase GalE [Pseudomonadota bacterium]
MTNILVTGGAGYIGSHTSLALAGKGYVPVAYDSLVNGHREFVQWGPFEQGDIRDRSRLDEVIARYNPVAIVHFAGLIEVGRSIRDPVGFFDNNVTGSIVLFAAAERAGIDKIVFSSTCATYGLPQHMPMRETHPQSPISPYGTSKWMVERMLHDLDVYKNIRSVILRNFNAAGADPAGRIGGRHGPESHVIPVAIAVAQREGRIFKINGSDYPTRDGTCVRDFIHVADLADAHCRAIDYLIDGGQSVALNLGTGRGTSLKELVAAIESVARLKLTYEIGPRRNGDPPELVADNALAASVLGWTPRHDLASIVSSAWTWHQRAKSRD